MTMNISDSNNVKSSPPKNLDKYGRLTQFDGALRSFLDDLKAINRAFLLTSASLDNAGKEPSNQFAKDLAKYTPKTELDNLIKIFNLANKEHEGDRNLSVTLSVPPDEIKDHRAHIEDFFGIMQATRLVKRSFIFTLIGQYDAFVGNMVRSLLHNKPEILNGSDRTLSFSQLSNLKSIDEAKLQLVDKEVETVLRGSHTEQFEWFEKKLGINLRSGLSIWSVFIELTERRNLFAHGDGVVSDQYLSVCKNNGVDSKGLAIGHSLDVTNDYFREAHNCLFEIGVKLAHVLWRVVNDHDRENADENFISITYRLIREGNYTLSIKLLEFFLSNMKKKYSDERTRLVALINLAQSYKWNGNEDKKNEIMSQQDWTALSDDFKIAKHVLNDEFDAAADYMRRDGFLSEECFVDWPLFVEFRKTSLFQSTYLKRFGRSYGESASVETVQLPTNSVEGERVIEEMARKRSNGVTLSSDKLQKRQSSKAARGRSRGRRPVGKPTIS
jgi:hypothetical protein